jgi:hypothetical protein
MYVLLACQSGDSSTNNSDDSSSLSTNANSTNQNDSGWISLFDGQTLNGWHTYGRDSAGSAWSVDSGAIHLNATNKDRYQTKGGGDLVSNDEFGDFHLKLEWNISKNGNSGIIFYVHEDTAKYKETWNTGLEMQVLDNNGHADAKIPKHRAGNLYDLIAAKPETVKPPGEWNQAEIRSENGKLDLFLNGTNVVSTTLWDDNWKKLVAGSKFKTMQDFATYKSGHIALQDHGDDVWFRNIMIRKL